MSATLHRLLIGALALAACVDPEPTDRPAPASEALPAYPAGPYAIRLGATLPDLAFEGVDEDGQRATIELGDYWTSNEPPRVLLVQVTGGLWCGTCRAAAEHLSETLGASAARVERLDVVLRDRDNAPASADRDALAWREAVGAESVSVAADPAFVFGEALEGRAEPLPLMLLVDTRTMVLVDVLSNPDPDTLAARVARAIAAQDGSTAEPSAPEPLVDGLFYRNEWAMLEEMAEVPSAPPADPTNEVADSRAAAELGEALFFDAALSPSGTVSCATCHDPAQGLSDGKPRAEGMSTGDRRTPAIALSAHARWQDWDGKADTTWAQALGPLENPKEFGSSRVFVARRVIDAYADAYASAFPGRALPSPARWPASGKPGDAGYDALDVAEKAAITRVFVDAGKAIAAYERTFRVEPTAFDRYVHGDASALNEEEKYGLVLFVRSGCTQCHWGPRFTDDAFHDTGAAAEASTDPGRLHGREIWEASEFRADGPWSASPAPVAPPAPSLVTLGQFKTPSLRGVAGAAFFGHDGSHASLPSVTETYGTSERGEPWLPRFTETAQWGLVPFLRTLTATPIERR